MITEEIKRRLLQFEEQYPEPEITNTKDKTYLEMKGLFETRVYQHFTFGELFHYMEKYPNFTPTTACVLLRQKMLQFCNLCEPGSSPMHLFSVMADTLQEITDYLLSYKEA